ncbi:MAG: calcium/sodium antiporter [bacterium]
MLIVFNLAFGLILLILGGNGLVKGSVALAKKMGISPLVIGLTIVSFGTSSPELLVSIQAALAGHGSVAMGNIIGSNSVNIGFILGLSALIYPLSISLQIVKKELPILIGVTFICSLFLLDGYVSRLEGVLFFAGIFIYTYFSYYLSKRYNNEKLSKEIEKPVKKQNTVLSTVFIIGGLILLSFGSNFFVEGAVAAAKLYNVSEALIGLTIVALGTSLPELFTSVIASFKKESDIAVGNIIGSNIFNLLGILGTASIIKPISSPQIDIVDFAVMNAFTLLLLPLLWTGFKLTRIEGSILVAGYIGYLVYLIRF